MKVPSCRVLCLGEISQWGKNFLYTLQATHLIDLTFEPIAQNFLSSPPGPGVQVVAFEHRMENRATVQLLRSQGRKVIILWFGRTLAKEDYEFGMENRIYWLFDNPHSDNRQTHEVLRRLVNNVDGCTDFDQLMRSMKGLLLQDAEDERDRPLLTELKTAVAKIERSGGQNEFVQMSGLSAAGGETRLPFHQSQSFGDALWTVNDLERTGVLWVRGQFPAEEGKVEFLQGRIVSGQTGRVRGMKAIYRMFLWDKPKFLFVRKDPKEATVGEQLTTSMKYLTSEGESLKARFEKIRRELPPPSLQLMLEPSALHPKTSLTPIEFSALSSVIEFGKVGQVIDYNDLPDVDLYESLIKLRRNQVIRVAA